MTREITIRPERYVSIFEDATRFGTQLKVAEMLSRTQFVPKAFQGRPEDCLVALDMAGRLELNPLAVFPDIYVIDGRAAFSSKFLIALVNRSGRFTRIQFETGIDGEAEVTFGAWGEGRGQRKRWKVTLPNHYAVASFSDLSSGNVYESPRVDMNFAERNGWFEKDGSKWRTMPEIMTRYRAASILIKSVCPEIVMGLEFADDLLDAREEPRPVVLEPKPSASSRRALPAVDTIDEDTLSVDELEALIRNSVDKGALDAAAKTIQEYELDEEDAERLRRAWRERRAELFPPKTGLPGETTFNTNAALAAINAASADELDAIMDEVDAANADGRISERDYADIKARVEEKRNAETLRLAMIDAAKELDAARLESIGEQIDVEEEEEGLTTEQANVLRAQLDELMKELNHEN